MCRAAAVAALLAIGLAGQATAQADAPDLDLAIRIDPATGSFSAETVIEAPRGDVILPAADWLSIDAVTLAGAGGPVTLPPDRPAVGQALHRSRDLRVSVSGRLPGSAPTLAAVAWTPEATYALGPALVPVDGTTIRDHRITITLPAGQRAAATGSLLSDRVAGDRREARFVFTGRSDDLALFVGPYALSEADHATGRLRTYFDAPDAALSERYFDALSLYLDRYAAEIGAYPYDGFSVVSARIPVGLGFAGLTYVSRDILGHPYMTGRSLAHEVLHSWWGNAVGVDYATGNWAEGLTTFQADYALAEDDGPEAARDMRIGWVRDLALLPEGGMTPLAAFRAASHAGDQSEGYGKAAFVFHMLRDEIGPSAFSEGIRGFYRQNRNRIAGWADLERAFEVGAGRDLGWFFEQWVARPGLPRVTLDGAELADGAGGAVVTLRIGQDRPAYRLRLPVVFEMASGPPERRIVEVAGPETRVQLTLPEAPRAVRIDPDFDLARQPLQGELAPILRSVGAAGPVRAVAASPLGAAEGMIARALSPMTGLTALPLHAGLPAPGTRGATIVVGLSGDVLSRRPAHLGPAPDIARAGTTRVWVEQAGGGALWLFLSYDDPEAVGPDLRSLRFYAGQSHVAFDAGRAISAGVWPVTDSAAEFRFDPAPAAGALP